MGAQVLTVISGPRHHAQRAWFRYKEAKYRVRYCARTRIVAEGHINDGIPTHDLGGLHWRLLQSAKKKGVTEIYQ